MNSPTAPSSVQWRSCHFDQLSLHELSSIFMARQLVFSVEQNCAYLDADGHDDVCWHVAAWAPEHRVPLAYARVLPPGEKYAEASIGRVVTTSEGRGLGLGRELVRRAIEIARQQYPGHGIRISAQSYLEGFYGSFGFLIQGERYMEDGIPHTEMLLPAQAFVPSPPGRGSG